MSDVGTGRRGGVDGYGDDHYTRVDSFVFLCETRHVF